MMEDYDKKIKRGVDMISLRSILAESVYDMTNSEACQAANLIAKMEGTFAKYRVKAYSHCCGIVEFHGWSHDQSKAREKFYDILVEMLNYMKQLKRLTESKTDKLLQIVVLDSQNFYINKDVNIRLKDAVELMGFQKIRTFTNITGSVCNIYQALASELQVNPFVMRTSLFDTSSCFKFYDSMRDFDWTKE